MGKKQQFIFIGSVIAIAVLACQSNAISVPSPQVLSTQTGLFEYEYLTPTATSELEGIALQPNFLADPNTACAFHHQLISNSYPSVFALSCLDSNGWHVYGPDAFEDPLDVPWWIAQCPDGRIYLNMGSKPYVLEDGTLVEIGDALHQIIFLACGAGHEIWAGLLDGVGHYDGIAWTDYPATEYLGSGENVRSRKGIAIAPNGNVWVATSDSIATFDGTNWQVFEAGKGFEENPNPRGLAVDANGNVWVVNIHGLMKYDGVQWSTFYEGAPKYWPSYMAIDEENRVWVAAADPTGMVFSTIYTFDPQTNSWALQFDHKVLSGTVINAMQFDRQGRLWVATNYGLDIYDGSVWTAYHTYTADLYANSADAIFVLGNGPQLPALAPKAPGSIHGKLVNTDPATYTNMQVEICLESVKATYFGDTPCADQAYHVLTTVDTDGNFVFTDIPVGKYFLMIQKDEDTWSNAGIGEFEVNPGALTEFGEIVLPPN